MKTIVFRRLVLLTLITMAFAQLAEASGGPANRVKGFDITRGNPQYRMVSSTDVCPLPPVITPFDYEYDCRNTTVSVYQATDQLTLGPGFASEDGANFVVQIVPPAYGVPQATNLTGTADANINWIQATAYDENGNVISDEKKFYDNNGRGIQTQAKVFYRAGASTTYTHVLASQPIRDAFGREAATTLPAPIDYADFSYRSNFLQRNTAGTVYNHQNFDISSSGNKTDNPDPLWDASSGTAVQGTLAWYYNKVNNWEPYTGETSYPFSRQTYYQDGTGNTKKLATAGDQLRMGLGREESGFITPVANELDFYLQVRNKYFVTTDLGALPASLQSQAMQVIARDANGREGVAIQDRSGKTMLTARAGTDQVVNNTVTVGGSANPDENIWYFRLMGSGGPVTITGGSFTLYDMNTEAALTSFTSGNTLSAGYYKLVNTGTSAISLSYSNGYADIGYNFYNQLGQLVASISPEGVKKLYGTGGNGLSNYATRSAIPFISLYIYDVRGNLVSSQSPDEGSYSVGAYTGGIHTFIYRNDGKLRFSQSPIQTQMTPQAFSYTNYDALGRPIEVGQYQPDASGISYNSAAMTAILENTTPGGGLTTGTKTDVSVIQYDVPDNSHGLAGYIQDASNLGGIISLTKKYSSIVNNSPVPANLQSATWYNYDEEGKPVWVIKYINGLGYKTTDYSYDPMGRLVKQVYQAGTSSETFVHYFDYDPVNKSLWHVYTNTVDNKSTWRLQATYSYYLHGGVKRMELAGNLQGIDYTYTLQGGLKAINNSNKSQDPGGDGANGFAADAFGEVLDYYSGDYVNDRSGIASVSGVNTASITGTTIPESYTGNIKAMSWYSEKPTSIPGATDAPSVNVFQYDPKYQFTENIWGNNLSFGTGSASFTPTTNYKERIGNPSGGVPAYDGNGNIQYLYRTDGTGNPVDQFTYNYNPNTNQLSSVVKAGGQNYATYGYSPNGQMVSESIGDGSTFSKYLAYDVSGKVVGVYKDAAHQQPLVTFVYDEEGQRIKKLDYDGSYQLSQVTYYAGDVVYTQQVTGGGAVTAQEYQISGGNGRIGIYYPQSQIYAYQMTDHVGSVRAVIAQNGTTYQVRMYNDYYPFGMIIPGGGGTNDYRYDYQGQYSEKDGETGWNAFELRMYDSRIGRWLQYDPDDQFYSPFLGMGNDPVSSIDPNGAWIPPTTPGNYTDGQIWTDEDGSWQYQKGVWQGINGTTVNFHLDMQTLSEVIVTRANNTQEAAPTPAPAPAPRPAPASTNVAGINKVLQVLRDVPSQPYQYGGTGVGNYSDYLKAKSKGIDCSCFISTGFGEKGRVWSTSEAPPARWGLQKVNIGSTKPQIFHNLQNGDLLVWSNTSIKHTGMVAVINGTMGLYNSHSTGPGITFNLETFYFSPRHPEVPLPSVYRKK